MWRHYASLIAIHVKPEGADIRPLAVRELPWRDSMYIDYSTAHVN